MVLVVGRFTVKDADHFLTTTHEFTDLGRMLIDAYEPNKILILKEFLSLGAAYRWVQSAAFAKRSERAGIENYSLEYFTDIVADAQALAS
jgi:hypothetical protein